MTAGEKPSSGRVLELFGILKTFGGPCDWSGLGKVRGGHSRRNRVRVQRALGFHVTGLGADTVHTEGVRPVLVTKLT